MSVLFAPKRLIAPLLLTAAFGCGGDPAPTAQEAPYVAVTQIVEHPALDAVRNGIQDQLVEEDYSEADGTLEWTWESAQGQPATAAQIAQKFVGENPDLIVAIATPSAQAAVAATDDIPVVFSAVTDPVGAELVESLERPGGKVTGVSDLSPIDRHLELIGQVVPGANTIGVIYNAGEANSVSLVELINSLAPELELSVVEATVANSSEVATAAESLVGQVDAIYVPTDNTVVSALEAVLQVGADNQLPVFAGDTDSVERGAIATASFDYYEVGRQTGAMAARILGGESPGAVPVELAQTVDLAINLSAAEAMGVVIPDNVQSEANQVFD